MIECTNSASTTGVDAPQASENFENADWLYYREIGVDAPQASEIFENTGWLYYRKNDFRTSKPLSCTLNSLTPSP